MACRFIDGFDNMTAADLTLYNKWNGLTGTTVGSSATHLRFGTGTGQYITGGQQAHLLWKDFGSNEATGIFGIAFKIMDSTQAHNILSVFDGSDCQCLIGTNATRNVVICRNTVSNVLGTSTIILAINTWYYLEWKWKITNSLSSGDMIAYIDGVQVLTVTSGDSQHTANAYGTIVQTGGNMGIPNSNHQGLYRDDFYWFDLTGSTCNAVVGECRVQSLLPNGNGNSSQFTGSDGNSTDNYLLIDETTPNGDTDYVESGTVGHRDLHAFTDTNANTGTIHCVAVNQVAKKTDAAARTINATARVSGTNYDSADVKTLSTGYVNFQTRFELNPATSTAWTKSTVDGAEFGIEVES